MSLFANGDHPESSPTGNASPTIHRRSLAWAAGAILFGGVFGFPLRSGAVENESGPEQAVQTLNAGLTRVMQAGATTPFNQRFQMLAPVVDQTFDLSAVLIGSVGPRWSTLSEDDHAQLADVFRRYTVASFVANFDKYKGAPIVSSGRSLPNGEATVDSKMGNTDISFVLRTSGAGWRVVDVLANGTISRVAVQRSDFRELLQQGGGQALVSSLQRKVNQLSGGTLV
jgi:phospholipid transport system substrate-binding protein